MSFIQRLLKQPQGIWLRRALFQVHLWTGIATGLYVVLICVSGSVLVFRTELHTRFTRPPVVVTPAGGLMTDDQLKEGAQKAYPDYTVTNVWRTKNPDQAVELWLDRNGKVTQRIFNPYTGDDLGPSQPAGVRFILWLVSFHDNLTFGETGRFYNGVGSVILTLLCVTGAVIWWPGLGNLRRSLTIELKSNWKRINWGLHSVLGFWAFLLVLMWAVSGVYLVWPETFAHAVDYFDPLDDASTEERFGDFILRWTARIHFGRFAGWPVKALWVVTGLIPPALFVTGALMWWNRVLYPFALSRRRDSNLELADESN